MATENDPATNRTLWSAIGMILVVGGIYAGLIEWRVSDLQRRLEIHAAIPIHPQADVRVAVIEQRQTRMEGDLRNHVTKLDLIQKSLMDHDQRTQEWIHGAQGGLRQR